MKFQMAFATLALAATGLFAEVPDAFVEYIESTNTASYVNTGIAPNPKRTRMVVKLAPMVVNNTQVGFFGSGNSWGNNVCNFVLLNSSQFRLDWIGNQVKAFQPTVEQVCTFDCCNNVASINGQEWGTTANKTDADYPERPILLFNAANGDGKVGGAKMRLYSCRVYQDGTTLSALYVPCVKDGVPGLYNTVDGTILYDASETMPFAASEAANADFQVIGGVAKTKVAVSSVGAGGTLASPAEQWANVGEALTLTATPAAGNKAVWTVTNDRGVPTMTIGDTLSYSVTGEPATIALSFAPANKVATSAELYMAIKTAADGDVIDLAAGEFLLSKTLALDKAITVKGAGVDKSVIRMPSAGDFIAVSISHADAVLEDVALTGVRFTVKPSTAASGGTYNASGQHQANYPLGVRISAGTFRNAVVRDNYATLQFGYGPWADMIGGTIENVQFLDNYYNRTGNAVNGYVLRMSGGVVTNCVFARNGCPGEDNGAIYMTGGTLVDSSIHHNAGGAANYHGGLYVSGSGAKVERCQIYNNNNGLYLANGTVANCLIYNNGAAGNVGYYAGVNQAGGNLYYCTIYGNVTEGDSDGKSGLQISKGTAKNNIIFGNGPGGSAAGSVCKTGGTFEYNLTDVAVAGTGNVVGSPAFANAANGDFSLTLSSAAIGVGMPIVGYATDFILAERTAAPSVGAYEYAAGTTLACGIKVEQSSFKEGGAATVSAIVEGATAPTFAWYVDGSLTTETSATPSFSGLAAGLHTVRLVVTDGGRTVEATVANAFALKPVVVYVAKGTSPVYPYSTPESAANSISEALTAVYSDLETVGRVNVAEGLYEEPGTIILSTPCEVVGAGRDVTVISGARFANGGRGAYLSNAQALLKDLTITGCTNQSHGVGVYLANGTLDNVHVTRGYQKGSGDNYNHGAGVLMENGLITNSLIDYNYLNAGYHGSSGVGVYMTGGLLVDSDICHNWMTRTQHNGIGLWTSGGTVRGCRIFDNYSTSNSTGGSGAGNCSSGHGINMSKTAVVENCLIYSNGWNGVMMTGGTLRNCAVFGHRQGTADYFAGVNITKGEVVNCTISDNAASGDSDGKSGLWQTGGTVVNTIIYGNGKETLGSCQVASSGTTFKTNITDKAVASGVDCWVLDPNFVNPVSDFHLGKGSPAIDKAAPLADCDLEGTPRPQRDGYDIGCYEMPPTTEPVVTISAEVVEGPVGMFVEAVAHVENVETNGAVYRWTLKDAGNNTIKDLEESAGKFSWPVDATGIYSLSLDVVAEGKLFSAEDPMDYTVKPNEVYVSLTGSCVEPYDTPEKATTNVNAALSALWQSASSTSTVHIAEGTYALSEQLLLANPVRVLGAGRDATVLNGSALSKATRGITMTHADAVVRDLTLTGCTNELTYVGSAIRQENGLLDNVRITKTTIMALPGSTHARAGSLYLSGGVATNLFIDGATSKNGYGSTRGLGAYIVGGLLTDSVVCSNGIDRAECYGIGVYMLGGTLRRTRIFDCTATIAGDTRGVGLTLHADGSTGNSVAENVSVVGCPHAVYVNKGELRNALVTGGTTTRSDFAGGLTMEGGTVVNCTLADNANSALEEQGDLLMKGGTAVNTIAVKANVTGGTSRNNCFNESVAFKTDYSLLSSAVNCINQGDNSVWDGFENPKDFFGNARISRQTVDIGCAECNMQGFILFFK